MINLSNWFRLSHFSIRKKLTLSLSLLILLIIGFIYYYFPNRLENQYFNSVREKAHTIANMTASHLSPALIYYIDSTTISEVINQVVSNNRDIEYIVVLDTKNRIIHSFKYENAHQYNYNEMDGNSEIIDDKSTLKVKKAIYYEHNKLGYIYLGFSLVNVNNEIDNSRLNILYISLSLLIVSLLVVYLIASFLTEHIKKVVNSFGLIADGNLSHRVPVTSKDEIGYLSESFNKMVDNLQNAYIELQNEIVVRKKTEEELNKAKEDLFKALDQERKANELKSRFISMVSHEYRTPLTVILTSTYLLEIFFKNQKYEEFQHQLSRIHNCVQEMTDLLNDVLEVGKFSSSSNKLYSEQVELNYVITEIADVYRTNDKDIHIIKFNSNSKECYINTDRKLINHILTNLLSNALKYSPAKSEIIVDLINHDDEIELKFSDSGIGIPSEEIDILFEPFFRANNTTNIVGTGLGLAIVKNSVDSLGGTISVQSEKDKGTCFTIILPKNINQNKQVI